jgi:hypothetical protein
MSEPINFFLWVSHGANVSSENNFYPIQTKFKSIILYSKPFQIIYKKDLEEAITNPCRLVLGTCPYIPVNSGSGNHVFLPPLIFINKEEEPDEDVKQYTGLYHFVLDVDPTQTSNPSDIPFGAPLNCVVTSDNKLYDHDDFINIYGTTRITYSQIFKLVTDKSRERNLNLEDVLLGIYSCQEVIDAYSGEYVKKISNLIPKRIDLNLIEAAAPIFTTKNYPKNSFVSINVIKINRSITTDWNALAKITHQGCALNVLSYFGIIPETSAREQTVCLSLKGTSIFKIVDFINLFINETTNNPPLGYFVLRLDFNSAIWDIVRLLSSYSEDNYFIIFKMYTKKYQENTENTKYSHIGHTVAMFKSNNLYYYVDPQASIFQELTDDVTAIKSLPGNNENYFMDIISTIKSLPGNNENNFIDIIYSVRNEFPQNRPNQSTDVFIIKTKSQGLSIVERTPDINFGGKKLFKKKKNKSLIKIKNKSKSMKKRKNNKSKSIKKRKNNKSKKSKKNHIGGNDETKLDKFEQLMIDIDKEHNIPTALGISVIKDIP